MDEDDVVVLDGSEPRVRREFDAGQRSTRRVEDVPGVVLVPLLAAHSESLNPDRAGPIDLDKLETLLPTLDIYETSLFYNGLITWRSLAELRQKYLTTD